MFSSGSQLLCLQQRTGTGRERGAGAPRRPRYRPGTGEFIRGQTGPSCPPARAPGPGACPHRGPAGRAGEKGPGEAERGGGGHAAAGRGEPRASREGLRFHRAGGRGGGAGPVPARRGGGCSGGDRPGPGKVGGEGVGGSGAPRGGGEGRAAIALICKQKERRDPNKSGRAGGTPAAAHRTAHRSAQPRSLGGPAPPLDQVLQLALRRETERGALAAAGGGGRGGGRR